MDYVAPEFDWYRDGEGWVIERDGYGSITTLSMTKDEKEAAKTKRPFGFQAPLPPPKKRARATRK